MNIYIYINWNTILYFLNRSDTLIFHQILVVSHILYSTAMFLAKFRILQLSISVNIFFLNYVLKATLY